MFSGLRHRIGRYYLQKDFPEAGKNRQVKNLARVRSIGLIYLLNSVPDHDEVEKIVTLLQKEEKEVRALGFVREKRLIGRFLPRLAFDYVSRHDLNWYYKPGHERVIDFARRDFDLLIDLSDGSCMPLNFVAGMSNALCRIGRFTEKNKMLYDLMIEVKPEVTVGDFFNQVRHYLTIINAE